MTYSRRNFLKAAGSGIVLTAVVGEAIPAALAAPLAASPMTREKASFLINGRPLVAEYEARTTLWEVIAVQLGLTGTNRSCNKASCGACSVLVDGTPFYSCHTLACEAAGKKILTIEGVGDEKNLHPLQRLGHARVAADCGFCTAGWVVTAKALLDKNPNPSEQDVKAALGGHICRCASYPAIIRTVRDSAALLRGEKVPGAPEFARGVGNQFFRAVERRSPAHLFQLKKDSGERRHAHLVHAAHAIDIAGGALHRRMFP